MIPIDIPEARLTLYFPQSLAECDERQYMEMCELIFKYQAEQISFEDLKIHAVYKLLNIKRSKKQQSEEDDLQLFYNISQLAEKYNCNVLDIASTLQPGIVRAEVQENAEDKL